MTTHGILQSSASDSLHAIRAEFHDLVQYRDTVFPCLGAMGTRTVHQLDAKAQMVVHVTRSQGTAEGIESGDESEVLDAALEGSAMGADMKVQLAYNAVSH